MTEYMQYIRQYVGHGPVLQVGASVIVEDELGRILLQKRADNHCWGYHGGAVERMKGWRMLLPGNYMKKQA